MALGAMSSLGLGSSGVLSYDIIDKLKKADESAIIKPTERKLADLKTQKTELAALITSLSSVKALSGDLSTETNYLAVKANVTGSNISATAIAGVTPQDFTINVSKLAKGSIHESIGFNNEDSIVTTADGEFKFKVGSEEFTLSITANTTLSELRDKINDAVAGVAKATILDTGDGANPFKLILKSEKTGVDNAVSFVSSTLTNLNTTDFTETQASQDAEFKFNGTDIKRSTNTIEDLITGVTITLNKTHENATDTDSVSITRDTGKIKDFLKEFVTAFNSMSSKLSDLTKYNSETKEVGVFQGVSQVSSISGTLNRTLLDYDTTLDTSSLASLGITIDKKGLMSFNESDFDSKVSTEFEDIKKLLYGYGSSETTESGLSVEGIFTKLNNSLNSMISGDKATLNLLDDKFDEDKKKLEKNLESDKKRLDTRYEMMAVKFASYDEMISKLNLSFNSLQMQIEAAINAK